MQLQPGFYFGKLIGAVLTEMGEKKTPAMALTFDITSRANGDGWENVDPITRDVVFYLSEKSQEFAFADLKALGFDGNMDAPGFAPDLTETGTELEVVIEPYNGKDYERVKITKLKRGSAHSPASADVRRSLAAKFRTAHGGRPSTPPPSRPASSRPAATVEDPNTPPF